MSISKEVALIKINDLVDRFEEQYASYKKTDYNETMVRRDFIDPFFKALGWDVDNSAGNAEAYREVIHEDRVKIGKETKAPDYSFRLAGGKRLFFVEAKKPSVVIKDDIHPAYQVRRYGWSAKMAISIEKIPIIMGTEKQVATIIDIVSNIINHKEDLKNTKLDTKRNQLAAKIEYLNEKIDKMVYEIYGLSEEEIGIVKNVSK